MDEIKRRVLQRNVYKADLQRECMFKRLLYLYHYTNYVECFLRDETYKLSYDQLRSWEHRLVLLELIAYQS